MKIQACAKFMSQGRRLFQEDSLEMLDEKGLFVIADGFGGSAGKNAADLACASIQEFLEREARDEEATLPFIIRSYYTLAGNVLFNSILHANKVLNKLNESKNVFQKGGATCLAGYLDGDLMALASVGDCGATLIRNGRAQELVNPRSLSRLNDPMDQAEFEGKIKNRIPLAALGMFEDLEPEITEFRVQAGDWLVLYTDGFGRTGRELVSGLKSTGPQTVHSLEEILEGLKTVRFDDNASCGIITF